MSNSVAIRVEGLSHSFGKGALCKQILFDITTEIQQGEIIIVTGPSGSGKTTLLTIVSALRTVQQGSVKVLGQELNGAKPSVLESIRRDIGFIFQQHNLLNALTAVQNVELGLNVSVEQIQVSTSCFIPTVIFPSGRDVAIAFVFVAAFL